jgi:hypothetical protein
MADSSSPEHPHSLSLASTFTRTNWNGSQTLHICNSTHFISDLMHVSCMWCYRFIMALVWSSPSCLGNSSLCNHKQFPSKTTFLSTCENTVHLKVSIALFTMYKHVFPEAFPQQRSTVLSGMLLHARSTFHAMNLSATSQESSSIFGALMIVPDYLHCPSHGTDIAACLLHSFEGTWQYLAATAGFHYLCSRWLTTVMAIH